MHQDAAHGVEPGGPVLARTSERLMQNADRLHRLPRITEFRRVVQHENGSVRRLEALQGGPEVPRPNRRFVDPPVGKESIRRLGIRPVLASQWDGLSESGCQLPNKFPESPSEPRVTKPAAGQFLVESLRGPTRCRSSGALQSP